MVPRSGVLLRKPARRWPECTTCRLELGLGRDLFGGSLRLRLRDTEMMVVHGQPAAVPWQVAQPSPLAGAARSNSSEGA
jgi:hypothetical protein